MLSKEEVNHIAKLARLSLNKEETDKLQAELSSILDYIEKLKEVDVDGVEPPYPPDVDDMLEVPADHKVGPGDGRHGDVL